MPWDPDTAIGGPAVHFPTTWGAITEAAGPPDLNAIAEAYWKPAYKYVRIHWNKSNEEAKDLTQGFFASLVERGLVERFDPGRGRFRTYLRTCIDGYVANANAAATRVKRGGGAIHESFDFAAAERELASASPATPEEIFSREWRRSLFSAALAGLRLECDEQGKAVYYLVFQEYDLAGSDRPSYAGLAARHGIAESAVLNYLRWCRQRLRALVVSRVERSTPPGYDRAAETQDAFR